MAEDASELRHLRSLRMKDAFQSCYSFRDLIPLLAQKLRRHRPGSPSARRLPSHSRPTRGQSGKRASASRMCPQTGSARLTAQPLVGCNLLTP